jgi:spoIIIJ-associated protein
VEWVEVTGKTVEEATEHALEQLGVAEGDAEVILVTEAKTGLFGRVREEARVRARVRPVGARPKRERSRRPSRSAAGRQGGSQRSSNGGSDSTSSQAGSGGRGSSGGSGGRNGGGGERSSGGGNGGGGGGGGEGRAAAGSGTSRSARRRRNRSSSSAAATPGSGEVSQNGSSPSATRPPRRTEQGDNEVKETDDMAEGMTLEEQGEVGRAFLAGLLSEYGMEATCEDLGILVGPRGSTLLAVQDLTRAVVQRQCPSRTDRILVDVAGYREKRSAALKRFSTQIAEEVLSSGQEKALEAMSPADRKAVHDAINEMDGVVTRSEGEDPNRYIVIAPAG